VKPSLVFCHTLAYGNICVTVGLGWPGDSTSSWGGASLEMCRGRKTEYLDIPLKDSIKGWRLEWFIIENHGNSLPPRSQRQPDVRTPSWTESPTDLEVAEAGALLVEVGLLKEKGLTAELWSPILFLRTFSH
jgi:hypothetical protein